MIQARQILKLFDPGVMIDTSPEISSFIIRFVHTGNAASQTGENEAYRGTIRHIHSNQEIHFTDWKDALAFISHFVPIEATSPSDSTQALPGEDHGE